MGKKTRTRHIRSMDLEFRRCSSVLKISRRLQTTVHNKKNWQKQRCAFPDALPDNGFAVSRSVQLPLRSRNSIASLRVLLTQFLCVGDKSSSKVTVVSRALPMLSSFTAPLLGIPPSDSMRRGFLESCNSFPCFSDLHSLLLPRNEVLFWPPLNNDFRFLLSLHYVHNRVS